MHLKEQWNGANFKGLHWNFWENRYIQIIDTIYIINEVLNIIHKLDKIIIHLSVYLFFYWLTKYAIILLFQGKNWAKKKITGIEYSNTKLQALNIDYATYIGNNLFLFVWDTQYLVKIYISFRPSAMSVQSKMHNEIFAFKIFLVK